jgi:hypothetical protein
MTNRDAPVDAPLRLGGTPRCGRVGRASPRRRRDGSEGHIEGVCGVGIAPRLRLEAERPIQVRAASTATSAEGPSRGEAPMHA